MRLPFFPGVILLILTTVNCQNSFNHQDFVSSFNLVSKPNFSFENFSKVFFGIETTTLQTSQSDRKFIYQDFYQVFFPQIKDAKAFDSETFINTFGQSKDTSEFKSEVKTKSNASVAQTNQKKFDFIKFKKAFSLECEDDCTKLDYEKFAQTFNILKNQNKDSNVDNEKFVAEFNFAQKVQKKFNHLEFQQVFNLKDSKVHKMQFDSKKFNQTFLIKRLQFDYKRFETTFLFKSKDSQQVEQNGGSVTIIDQPIN